MAVKQNDIRIGSRTNPFIMLDNTNIISINCNLSCDLLCEQLPIDTLEIQCRYGENSTESIPDIPYATDLWYFNDKNLIGKFYVTDAKRTGKYVYTITAQSAIGVLDGIKYYGKLFMNAPALTVLQNIILSDGLRWTSTKFLATLYHNCAFHESLTSVKVFGWIPVCSKREALHHLLFACGLNLFKTSDGSLLFSTVSEAIAGSIDPKNEYDTGTIDLVDRVSLIEVTEHSYVQDQHAESVVLFDNTESGIDSETIVFFESAPIVVESVETTGTITIKRINENCAIVSGVGTLSGKPYSHTSTVISAKNKDVIDGRTISVSNATLVNFLNSNAVTDRLFAYYKGRKQMNLPIVMNGELCGYKYSCFSPYGDEVQAYIASMSINASAIAKADCKMISGYNPPKGSRGFSHCTLLTGEGTFTVPEEVINSDIPRIRVVLIGGGQGGYSGTKGESGPNDVVETVDDLAKPGVPGKNGSAGKVYVYDISSESIEDSYSFYCGKGGSGGIASDKPEETTPGDVGEDTLFGELSSQFGSVLSAGYLDILTGRIYAGPSPDYSDVRGGRGGGFTIGGYVKPENGSCVVNYSISAITGKPIGTIFTAAGSPGGELRIYKWGHGYDGAGSGGPCFDSSIKGGEAHVGEYEYHGYVVLGRGAYGDLGAYGICPMEISDYAYGQGGTGGMGGCAGGSCGAFSGNDYYMIDPGKYGGIGGKGGSGGTGSPGCILVYY